MSSHAIDIHIDWDGPLTSAQIRACNTASDRGVYQVYGHHPVYGSDVLLYIGKAAGQSFAKRIPQETWWADNRDAGRLTFYIGRLCGPATPQQAEWQRLIDLAERFLISTHSPANNTQKGIARVDANLREVHIFNYGHHRDILPEISGARWTSKLGEMTDNIEYGSESKQKTGNT